MGPPKAPISRSSGVTTPRESPQPDGTGPAVTATGQARVFLVKAREHLSLLNVQHIDWLKAEGNYTRVRAGRVDHLIRRGICQMEKNLGDRFFRISRAVIVSLDRVERLVPGANRSYVVRLTCGGQFKLTRRYARRLFACFGKPL